MLISPVASGSQPDAGKHTLGECGGLEPARCDWNQATNRPTGNAAPRLWYVRLNSRSALSVLTVSGSMGSSRSSVHALNWDGKSARAGGAGGCSVPAEM